MKFSIYSRQKGGCYSISDDFGEMNWLFNVIIDDILVIYVTAHRCAGDLKMLDLRSGSIL